MGNHYLVLLLFWFHKTFKIISIPGILKFLNNILNLLAFPQSLPNLLSTHFFFFF
jgi:hypothetical protein